MSYIFEKVSEFSLERRLRDVLGWAGTFAVLFALYLTLVFVSVRFLTWVMGL